jgi:hypothetical protein
MYSYIAKHNAHIIYYCQQAGIKEDEDEALNTMQNALVFKRKEVNSYIKFINHFGPALTGVAAWNNNKTTGNKGPSELLTVTDEAFIHLCIVNYSATWNAQEKQKLGEDVEISVSAIHSGFFCDSIETDKLLTNTVIQLASIYQG